MFLFFRPPSSCARAAAEEEPDAGRGDGLSVEDAERQNALRPAQTNAGTGVRHDQVGARLPSVPAAGDRPGARRVEPCDHGLEPEADVRPAVRLLRRVEHLLSTIEGLTVGAGIIEVKYNGPGCLPVAPWRGHSLPISAEKPSPTGC